MDTSLTLLQTVIANNRSTHHQSQRRCAARTLLLCLAWLAFPTTAQNQWTSMNGPYVYISDISIAGDSLYVAGLGVFLYDRNAQQWLPKGPDYVAYLSIEANPKEPAILFAERDTDFGWRDLDRSIDGGNNWEWTGLGHSPDFIPIAISPSDPNRVYAGRWRSDDQGASWDSIATPLPIWGWGIITVHPLHKDTLYLGTGGGVHKSLDGGATWDTLDLPDASGAKAIAIDPRNGAVVYVGVAGNGLFKSVDGGAQWTAINSGLTNLNFVGLAVDPNNSDYLYAATYGGGIYHSKNGGLEWETLNDALPSLQVTALAVSTRKIYVGFGEQEGVYQRESMASLQNHQNSGKPDAFGLSPNFPNPFNTQTTIQFQISNQTLVTLKIFSILGAQIITIVDEHLNAGHYTVNWDGKNIKGEPVSGGIYLYRLKSTSFNIARKMVLLK